MTGILELAPFGKDVSFTIDLEKKTFQVDGRPELDFSSLQSVTIFKDDSEFRVMLTLKQEGGQ
ncbi:MAG: hypothetical protein AAB276_01510 [Pseudomonadota bacterium]